MSTQSDSITLGEHPDKKVGDWDAQFYASSRPVPPLSAAAHKPTTPATFPRHTHRIPTALCSFPAQTHRTSPPSTHPPPGPRPPAAHTASPQFSALPRPAPPVSADLHTPTAPAAPTRCPQRTPTVLRLAPLRPTALHHRPHAYCSPLPVLPTAHPLRLPPSLDSPRSRARARELLRAAARECIRNSFSRLFPPNRRLFMGFANRQSHGSTTRARVPVRGLGPSLAVT
ncbi:hypothetical protein K439DRAFT_1619769 [Ramaria rubella]|nr:hypothetical protein K439DRAFT_1619769 [Ramaria rubella]